MKTRIVLAAALAAIVLAGLPAGAQELPKIEPPAPATLLDRLSESVVSIKCVLKLQMSMMGQSQDQERNIEVRGVLVNGQGLVMTSNTHFEGGIPPALRRMLGEVDIKAVPSDIKVLFGAEVEEYEAQLVARDSNLDLAFLQIMDLGDRTAGHIDLAGGVNQPQIGMELFSVTRLPRGFDCVPSLDRLQVSAAITTPRKMWAVSGEAFQAMAHPVFDAFGQPVGVLAIQEGSEGVSESSGEMDIFSMGDAMSGVLPVILPLEVVLRSQRAAEERAAKALADRADGDEEEPVEEPVEEEPESPPADDTEEEE